MSFAVPMVLIVLAGFMGWVACTFFIGSGDGPRGDYSFDFVTPVKHLMNTGGWVIVTLVAEVIYLLIMRTL